MNSCLILKISGEMDAVLYQTATSSCSSLPFGPCDALLAACATSIMKFVKRIVQIVKLKMHASEAQAPVVKSTYRVESRHVVSEKALSPVARLIFFDSRSQYSV